MFIHRKVSQTETSVATKLAGMVVAKYRIAAIYY